MSTAKATRPIARRRFLLAFAALAVVHGCDARTTNGRLPRTTAQTTKSAPPQPNRTPVLSALHVHATFSEGIGSMEAQLAEAERLGVRALWWTEHDWRMSARGYLDQIPVDAETSGGLTWTPGPLATESASGRHEFGAVTPDGGPPDEGYSLNIAAEAPPDDDARHVLTFHSDRQLFSTSLQGQTWSLWVRPEYLESGHVELQLQTSRRPATDGQEAGAYTLRYRFTETSGEPAETAGRAVVLPVTARAGRWSRVILSPGDDLHSAWPEIDGRDSSCTSVKLVAYARPGGKVSILLGAINIDRHDIAGNAPLETQRTLMSNYAAKSPAVHQLQGVEISGSSPHVCWYGGTPQLPATSQPATRNTVDEIHALGGIASYAHPFGVAGTDPDPAAQDSLLTDTAELLLQDALLGCDALEVGYRQRGGATLSTHESLWDACSRRGIFLTGLGVNDDHSGMNWSNGPNNFLSWLWSPSLEENDLLDTLRSGHVYFGDPNLFTGQLDLRTNSGGRMGAVVQSLGQTSPVELVATSLDANATLDLVRVSLTASIIPVTSDSAATEITTFRADQFVDGLVTASVPTLDDCLVRTRVRDSTGQVIALSNPLWLVSDLGDYAVPAHRLPR